MRWELDIGPVVPVIELKYRMSKASINKGRKRGAEVWLIFWGLAFVSPITLLLYKMTRARVWLYSMYEKFVTFPWSPKGTGSIRGASGIVRASHADCK